MHKQNQALNTIAIYMYITISHGIFYQTFSFSSDVYHTKRMQRVQCVQWSGDAKYVLSGSDEMSLRLWKANASEKLGSVSEA